jgi:transposase
VNTIAPIGLDLPKSVFDVHAVNAEEQVVLHRPMRRSQLLKWFTKLPPRRSQGSFPGAET